MKQPPWVVGGFEAFAKKTRHSAYQATMHRGLPGSERLAVITPSLKKQNSNSGFKFSCEIGSQTQYKCCLVKGLCAGLLIRVDISIRGRDATDPAGEFFW